MCEFMARWLSENDRWGSPVFIAGESYGGYRVGRLVRMLQEETGIGLNGAILISPALELTALAPSDYSVTTWVDLLPTMAGGAAFHGRSRAFPAGTSLDDVRAGAEEFASGDYATFLIRGAFMGAPERERTLARLADFLGLPLELVTRAEGRVNPFVFARELLRDERKVAGFYDVTITATDPFPDRLEHGATPDPTLAGIAPAYTAAINRQLRSEIGVQTDREYRLLSLEVNQAWKEDTQRHFFAPPEGATDSFRYGMALNPHMRAFLTHGRYDMATPYYASDRLRNLMRFDPDTAGRLTVRHFEGGHMFYAWEESRHAFTAAIAEFVAGALRARRIVSSIPSASTTTSCAARYSSTVAAGRATTSSGPGGREPRRRPSEQTRVDLPPVGRSASCPASVDAARGRRAMPPPERTTSLAPAPRLVHAVVRLRLRPRSATPRCALEAPAPRGARRAGARGRPRSRYGASGGLEATLGDPIGERGWRA